MPKVKLYASKVTSNINQEKPGKRSPSKDIQQQIQDGLEAHYQQRAINKATPTETVQIQDDHFSDNDYNAPDTDNYSDYNQNLDDVYPGNNDDDTSSEESVELTSPRRFSMIIESDDSDNEEQSVNTKDQRVKKITYDTESKHRFHQKAVAKQQEQPDHQSQNSFDK